MKFIYMRAFKSCCSFSLVRLFATLWNAAHEPSMSSTVSQEFAQTHVDWVSDAIQPSRSLSSPPRALNLSQRQGLFQWVSSPHQVTKVLELQLQHQSFQWVFRVDFFYDWLVWSPCYPRDPQESSPASWSKSINSLAVSLLYGPTLTSIHDYWENHHFDYIDLCGQMSLLFNMLSTLSRRLREFTLRKEGTKPIAWPSQKV